MDTAPKLNQTDGRSKKPSVNEKLFENLLTIDELAADLKGKFSKLTIYGWVKQGMPKQKYRGKLFFNPDEVALWLQRTSR